MVDTHKIIRDTLLEMREYCYSDGCILFDTSFCVQSEKVFLSSGSMIDTIARVIAERLENEVVKNDQESVANADKASTEP